MSEKEDKKNILERLVPVLLFASIGLAFFVGVLWQKVSNLEKGNGGDNAQVQQEDNQVEPPGQGKLSDEQSEKVPQVTDSDHIKGNKDAKVVIVEYSDLECPFCSTYHPTVQQAVDEYGDQIAWVYRHFPLDSLHPSARPAAIAAECVADVGGEEAFWNFIDEIFEDQTTISDLSGVASNVGVGGSEFDNCVEDGKFSDRVENDYQGGLSAGVTGTPGSFIINDKGETWLIPGALPYETLKATIDEALGG